MNDKIVQIALCEGTTEGGEREQTVVALTENGNLFCTFRVATISLGDIWFKISTPSSENIEN